MEKIIHCVKRAPVAAVLATALAIVFSVTAGAVVTAKSVSNHFADAALGKMGGNPQEVLNKIADRVVKKLGSKDGPLSDAQNELVNRIAEMAGQKFDGVDPNKMLNEVKGQVAAAGLAKIEGIDPQTIIDQVTKAVISQAMAQVGNIDVKSLIAQKIGTLDLNAIVRDQLSKIDVNKLIKEELDKIDINALIAQIVKQQMSSGNLLTQLLGGTRR